MSERASIAAAALIALLAVLQYSWINRLRDAERQRLRTGLAASAMRYSQEFNGEVARVFSALQVGRPGENSENFEDAAARIAGWRSASPYKRMMRGLYRTRGGDDGLAELLVFDPAQDRFETVPWPDRLAGLHTRLQERARAAAGPGWQFGMTVEDDIPAVVGVRPAGPPRGERMTVGGWTIAEFDLEYLRKDVFPELAQKHLGADYDVTIVERRNPAHVVWGTAHQGQPDATSPLLDFFPDRTMRGLQVRRTGPPGGRPGGGPAVGQGTRPPDEGSFSPPPRNTSGPPGMEGRWTVQVRHRAGSLDALVAQRRLRDLGVSFSVLLLLAVSMALAFRSTRRAGRLAHQQMEFVAGVSHELRTPLTVIASAADNLADGVVAGEPQVRRYGKVIRGEARRLTDMVEQLLRFSGLQSGRARYRLQAVDAGVALDRALMASRTEVSDAGLEVSREIQDGLPPLMADPAALEHCLGNLVANAVKHARDGKWIGVGAEMATGSVPGIEIRVEDRGPGIDPADLPHIFEPFYRGRSAVSNQVKGAGLGLSLVKRMVEAQGGTVTVASKPGAGAHFTLRFPLAPRSEA
jgi:signal transduction histidine kinase